MRSPIVDGFYVSRSKNLADSECINLYPVLVETKQGKQPGALYGTPGLDLLTTCGLGPIRPGGLFQQAGSLYVVSGQQVYQVSSVFTPVLLGTLGTSIGPVTIIGNGTQIIIFDGVTGTLIVGGVLSVVALPFSGPVSAAYQDGFGVVNEFGTDIWWQSNLFDLSKWDALNFSSADAKPDNIIAIGNVHREMWLLKEFYAEVWINAGLPGFVFQRIDGVFLETGILAPNSVVTASERLFWLSRNTEGQNSVKSVDGYSPKTISTDAISTEIAKYSRPQDAIAFAYHQEGHTFYVLNFAEATWVYDIDVQRWHRRAAFNNGIFERHWAQAYCNFANKRVVGDYRNGNLYALNLDTLLDNGTQRRWLRSWRALEKPDDKPHRFGSLRIDMQTGITVPDGITPEIVLRWSDDGGHTYPVSLIGAVGAIGETAKRVKFNRLGSTRNNSGLDRIFELSSSDQFYPAIIGAVLDP